MKKILSVLAFVVLSTTYVYAQTLKFWTPEEQPDRVAKQEALAAEFKAKTGISVQIIPVSEKDMGKRVTAAFAANDLPDILYHSLQHILPWAEAGILDIEAATEVVNDLNPQTFAQGPLNMAKTATGYATVPVDGWSQLVVYRKDWFEKQGLAAPTSLQNISAAVEKLHNPPHVYGFVAATKIDEVYMMQVLEHFLLANGYSVVNADGAINQDRGKIAEVLTFYKALAKASPPGELYWKQARELYFAGKTAMIVWSPFILDELAGLRNSAPPTINNDPQSRELAQKTGFITKVAGPGNPDGAGYADVRYFGITADAQTEEAVRFVKYALDEGYGHILSIAAEGKFPVRRGTVGEPNKFVGIWSEQKVGVDRKAPLTELYPKAVIDRIVAGLTGGTRWGIQENQLNRASKIISSLVFNRITRQYIDDEIGLAEAMDKLFVELEKIK